MPSKCLARSIAILEKEGQIWHEAAPETRHITKRQVSRCAINFGVRLIEAPL